MALEVGDLIAKLRLDAGQFTTSLKQAGVDMERFGAGLLRIGTLAGVAFGTAKAVQWAKEIARATEQTEHLSLMTGIAAQRFDEMSVALARVGLSGQDLALGFRQLSRHLVEARDASSEAAAAFDRVDIDPTKIRDSEQVLRQLADRFAAMPDGIDKAALAQELFGRAGARLIPILNQGSAGLDALTQKAREFGLVLNELQRETLTKLDDALDDLGKSFEGLKTQIGAFVAPAAKEGVDLLTQAVTFATFMFQELSAASVTLTARLANLGTFLLEAAKTGLQVGESAVKTRERLAALWKQLVEETEAVKAATEADKEKARFGNIVADAETKVVEIIGKRTAAERAQEAAGAKIVEDTQKALLVMERLGTSFEVAESMVRGRTSVQLEGVIAVARAEQQLGTDLQAMQMRQFAQAKIVSETRRAALQSELSMTEQLIGADQRRAQTLRQVAEVELQIAAGAGGMGPVEIALKRMLLVEDAAAAEKQAIQDVLRARLDSFAQQMALLDETRGRERQVLFEARVGAEQEAATKIAQLEAEGSLAFHKAQLEKQQAIVQTTAVRLRAIADMAAAELQLAEAGQLRTAEALRDDARTKQLRLAKLEAERELAMAIPTLTDEQLTAIEKNFEGLRLRITSELTDAAKEVQALIGNMFSALAQAIDRAVLGVIQGTTTLRQAFKQLGQSILLELTSRVIRQGLKPLFDTLATGLAQSFQFQGTTARGLPAGVQGPVMPASTTSSMAALAVGALAAAGALVTFVETMKQSGKTFEKVMAGVGLAVGAIVGGMLGGPAGAGIGALIGSQLGALVGKIFEPLGKPFLGVLEPGTSPRERGQLIGKTLAPLSFGLGGLLGNLIGSLFGGGSSGRKRNERDWINATLDAFKPQLEAINKALTPEGLAQALRQMQAGTVHGRFVINQETAQELLHATAPFRADFISAGSFRFFGNEMARIAREMGIALEKAVTIIVNKLREQNARINLFLADLTKEALAARAQAGGSPAQLASDFVALRQGFVQASQTRIDALRAELVLMSTQPDVDPEEILQLAAAIREAIRMRYQGEIEIVQQWQQTVKVSIEQAYAPALKAVAQQIQQVERSAEAFQRVAAAARAWIGVAGQAQQTLAELSGGATGEDARAAAGRLWTAFGESLARFRAAPSPEGAQSLLQLISPTLQAIEAGFAQEPNLIATIRKDVLAVATEIDARAQAAATAARIAGAGAAAAQALLAQLEQQQLTIQEEMAARIADATDFSALIRDNTLRMADDLEALRDELADMFAEMGFIVTDFGAAVETLNEIDRQIAASLVEVAEATGHAAALQVEIAAQGAQIAQFTHATTAAVNASAALLSAALTPGVLSAPTIEALNSVSAQLQAALDPTLASGPIVASALAQALRLVGAITTSGLDIIGAIGAIPLADSGAIVSAVAAASSAIVTQLSLISDDLHDMGDRMLALAEAIADVGVQLDAIIRNTGTSARLDYLMALVTHPWSRALLIGQIPAEGGFAGTFPAAPVSLPAPLPSFQAGTVRVPRTGAAMLHAGEMVLPVDQATAARAGRVVHITVTGNTILGDDFRVARKLAKLLQPELDDIVGVR